MESLTKGLDLGKKGVLKKISSIAGSIRSAFTKESALSFDVGTPGIDPVVDEVMPFDVNRVLSATIADDGRKREDRVNQTFNVYANDAERVCAMVAARQRTAMA